MPTRQLHPVSRWPRKRCKLTYVLWQLGISPGALGGDVNLKTIAGWAVVAFLIWWVIEQPTGAAHVVHNLGDFLSSAAGGISRFFTKV
jgi:hypothetical protein